MRASTVLMDRLLTGLVGAILLAGGLLVLASGQGMASARLVVDRIAPLADLPTAPWWNAAVAVAAVLFLVAGLGGLALHLRRNRPRPAVIPGPDGDLVVELRDLAQAVAEDLGRHPAVLAARGALVRHRRNTVIRVAAEVEANTAPSALRPALAHAAADVRRALGPSLANRHDVQFLVHARPLDH